MTAFLTPMAISFADAVPTPTCKFEASFAFTSHMCSICDTQISNLYPRGGGGGFAYDNEVIKSVILTEPCPSPIATTARKDICFPPFTTFVTRLICTVAGHSRFPLMLELLYLQALSL